MKSKQLNMRVGEYEIALLASVRRGEVAACLHKDPKNAEALALAADTAELSDASLIRRALQHYNAHLAACNNASKHGTTANTIANRILDDMSA